MIMCVLCGKRKKKKVGKKQKIKKVEKKWSTEK